MTRFTPPSNPSLAGKVVVLSGGSTGIGAAAVNLAHTLNATVYFGDIDTKSSEALLSRLDSPSTIHFVPCDVTKYADVLKLFAAARQKCGRIDHVIANAGVVERPGLFTPKVSVAELESRGAEGEPDLTALDVNLRGVLLFAHVACAYLADGQDIHEPSDKSLTLISSVAGFKEHPGLFAYGASKHGVLGLMRALRLYVPRVFPGVRVNAICPSYTETQMVRGIKSGWIANGLPTQGPDDVAKILVGVMVAGPGRSGMSGRNEEEGSWDQRTKASHAGGIDWDDQYAETGGTMRQGLNGRGIYVIGGEGWDIEEGLDRTEIIWLGRRLSELLVKANKGLGDGTKWTQ